MNKQEKEVIQAQLDSEKAILEKLERQYKQALNDIISKTKIIQADIDMLQASGASDDKTLSMVRSKVYQKQYQEALKKQIEGILDKLHSDEFSTIQAYLNGCYEDGYLGTLYDISSQGEGIPIMTSLDQNAIVKAVQLDSKISGGLYKSLGVDVAGLKKSIKAEISRGIASSLPYSDIARNITNVSNAPRSRAKTIVRTEGHRIQQQSAEDARQSAKDRGFDVVRVWDATLDGKTRPSHRNVDGEICELDGKFSNGLRYPGDPSGTAAEVVNCRCVALTKERWDAEGGFLKRDNFTGEIVSFDSPADYQEYKKKYWSKENTDYMDYVERLESKYETKDFKKIMENMTDREYDRYKKLSDANPLLKIPKEGIENYENGGIIFPKKPTAEAFVNLSDDIPEKSKQIGTILNGYTSNGSKWSGKTIVRKVEDMPGVSGRKEWSCDISLREDSGIKSAIHEHLHARSVSYYSPMEFVAWQRAEEGAVELFAQEIAKSAGIPYRESYRETVKQLRITNSILKYADDMTFAKELFETPMPERYAWLRDKADSLIETDKLSSKTVEALNNAVDYFKKWGKLE